MWITVDGIDGSGKTVAVQYLAEQFTKAGYTVQVVRGMGTGVLGTSIRELLLSQQLTEQTTAVACALALLDCYDVTQQHLAAGHVVISDRYIPSYYAYNVVGNQDLGASALHDYVLTALALAIPDIAILITVEVDTVIARLNNRSADELSHIDQRGKEYFEVVAAAFDSYITRSHPTYTIGNDGTLAKYLAGLDVIINNHVEQI